MFVFKTNTNKTHSSVLGNVTYSDDSKLSPANQSYLAHSNNEIATLVV